MNKQKFISIFLIFLLLLTGCTTAKTSTQANSSDIAKKSGLDMNLETKHFKFYCKSQDKPCLKDLSDVLETNYSRVTKNLKTSLKEKSNICIYSDLKTYHKAINKPNAPNYEVINADETSNTLQMLNPTKSTFQHSDFKKIIVSQFVYLAEHNINSKKNGIPAWLYTGTAFFEAQDDTGVNQTLSNAKSSNNFPTLKVLETASSDFEKNGGNQFSYSIVDYIVKFYGQDKLVALIKSPSNFEKIIGISKEDFQKKWIDYISTDIMPIQVETEHFKFYSKDQDKYCIKDLSNVLEENYSRVTKDLKATLNQKVNIYIYSNLNEYHKLTNKSDAPKWLVGDAEGNNISMTNPNNAAGRPYSDFMRVIVHEFTHVVEGNINTSETEIPIWLNEGTAEFETKQGSQFKQVLENAKSSNKFPTLKDLETDSYTFGNNNGYVFSYSIVDYIVKTYGQDKLVALIKSPSDFEKILGISKDDFQKNWVNSII